MREYDKGNGGTQAADNRQSVCEGAALTEETAYRHAQVPAPDFAVIRPDDFDDADYVAPQVWVHDRRAIPYYFAHFHRIANAVRLEGEHRGFIDIVVHRNPKHNAPFNSRVQENHLWLAYFYTRRASWNLYYAMPEVKVRLEAALEHLLTLQGPDGAISEYGWQKYNLPGTTFALQFLSQTLRLLREAGEADPGHPFIRQDLHNRLVDAFRKALSHCLRDAALWRHGTSYTNQYTLLWSAAAIYLRDYPDAELEADFRRRYKQAGDALMSPAGFYYENSGFDMGYNLGVHVQSMMADYTVFKNTDLESLMLSKEGRFIEWLSYNLVREPDGSFFAANASASGRTASSYIERKDIPMAEKLPLARAFVKTREEAEAEVRQAKRDIAAEGQWPHVPELRLTGGNAYNPYGLYNRTLYRYYPTEKERREAVTLLPYMARSRFLHQRIDDRSGLQFSYVRQPSYYAAFQAGPHRVNMQAFGLGLLWHPEAGLLLCSQTEHSDADYSRGLSWGTKLAEGVRVYESGDLDAAYSVDERPFSVQIGCRDLEGKELSVTYPLGAVGRKTVRFGEEEIMVAVEHSGAFEERLPLAIGPDDQLEQQAGSLKLSRGRVTLTIEWGPDASASWEQKDRPAGKYRLRMLVLQAVGQLRYTMKHFHFT